MKKYIGLTGNELTKLAAAIIIWRIWLFAPVEIAKTIISQRQGYLGPSVWSNFDGVHYLSIAERGYFQFQQAFFPSFPLLIRYTHDFLRLSYEASAQLLVHIFLVLSVIFLYKLAKLDFKKNTALSIVCFFLAFPTSFYLVSTYTESMFLTCVFASFYFLRKSAKEKKHIFISVLFAILATATRLVSIFLLPSFLWENKKSLNSKKQMIKNWKTNIPMLFIPTGLILYMFHLWQVHKNPIMFVTAQPAFGAGRSGGEIILLPQLLWRYLKIFLTVSPHTFDFWIALLEIAFFVGLLTVAVIAIKKKIRPSYILFSVLATLLPTLSGTLSSIPRYALSAFIIFIVFATIKNKTVRVAILIIGLLLQSILVALFARGYFIS